MLGITGTVICLLYLCVSAKEDPRVDCHPEPDPSQTVCELRSCKWEPSQEAYGPSCYFTDNTGYFLDEGATDDTATLSRNPNAVNPFYANLEKLRVEVKKLGATLNVKISNPDEQRYEVPLPFPRSPSTSTSQFSVTFGKNAPGGTFSFTVSRGSVNIWDTSIGGLLYGDQFLQIATHLPTTNIYGFGEHVHKQIRHNMTRYTTWPMFTHDNPPDSIAELSTKNLYGVHPFYMGIEASGDAHGVFILNSNAQEVTLGTGPHLVYRTIGGVLDFYFFPGPKPEDVTKQYHALIGTPMLPAQWALGFHLSRWGYTSFQELKNAVARTQAAGIPLDVVVADIDYMDGYHDFTVGWKGFKDYITGLQTQGVHTSLMTDISLAVNYTSFERALEMKASFISYPDKKFVNQDIVNKYPLLNNTMFMAGDVWPHENTVVPDFLEWNNTLKWWLNEFAIFRNLTGTDTIWIDMNEPSIFNTAPWNFSNTQPIGNDTSRYHLKCPINVEDAKYDNPKYPTNARWEWGKDKYLFSNTLCMNGKSGGGKYTHYDTHSLTGVSMAMATYEAQKTYGNRGATVCRSTYASSGHYVGHWLGDNYASWEDLQTAVIGAQEMHMFGITFTGSDICGFNGNTEKELCLRWQQMGAFHTFSRNHNSAWMFPQDPAQWPEVAAASRQSISFKYNYLPYLYTLMYEASAFGGTAVRPMFFEFPKDPETYNIGYQFMWGSGMMILPVLHKGVLNVSGYIPPSATWYDLREDRYSVKLDKTPQQTFSAKWTEMIPVFAKGGTILAKQRPEIVIREMRKNPFELLIASEPDQANAKCATAAGSLFWDDGESYLNSNFYYMDFSYNLNETVAILSSNVKSKPNNTIDIPNLGTLDIFGYPCSPFITSVKVNGQKVKVTVVAEYEDQDLNQFSHYVKIKFASTIELKNDVTISWDHTCVPGTTTTTPVTQDSSVSGTTTTALVTQNSSAPDVTATTPATQELRQLTTSSASSIGYAALLVLPFLYSVLLKNFIKL